MGFLIQKPTKSTGGLTIPVMIPPRGILYQVYARSCLSCFTSLLYNSRGNFAQGLQCIKHPGWHLLSASKFRVKTKLLKNNRTVPLAWCLLPSHSDAEKDKSCFSKEVADQWLTAGRNWLSDINWRAFGVWNKITLKIIGLFGEGSEFLLKLSGISGLE